MNETVQSAKNLLFKKDAHDIIRGLRTLNPNGVGSTELSKDEKKFLDECAAESFKEVTLTCMDTKMNAVKKLVYLNMMGFDISSTAFYVVELMSSTKFTHKRVGYHAATQCFFSDSDMILLATNQIKKDLMSLRPYESEMVLNALSIFMNADLAMVLMSDILSLLGASKPNIRRRALLLLYRVYMMDPELVMPHFDNIIERTLHPSQDVSVQSAMISVLCELIAKSDPIKFMSYMPQIITVMSNSSNNWMLIKIFKIFGMCVDFNEELAKKIADYCISNLQSTNAMSLLYQCTNTALIIVALAPDTVRGKQAKQLINLCVDKLKYLINDRDQNLRYLGLYSLSNLDEISRIYTDYESLLRCVDECQDESIGLRAIACLLRIADTNIITSLIRKITPQLRGSTKQGIDSPANNAVAMPHHPDYYHTVISELINKLDTLGFDNLNSDWLSCAILELAAVDDASVYQQETSQRLSSALIDTVMVAPNADAKSKVAKRCAQYLFNWEHLSVKLDAIWIVSKHLDCKEMRPKFLTWLLEKSYDWHRLLTALDMKCDELELSEAQISLTGLDGFERDLEPLFSVIHRLNEEARMTPTTPTIEQFPEIDLDKPFYVVTVESPKRKKPPKPKPVISPAPAIPPRLSEGSNAAMVQSPSRSSIASASQELKMENINYLGSVSTPDLRKAQDTDISGGKTKLSELMNATHVAEDDPFKNIDPHEGIDQSKIAKRVQIGGKAKVAVPKKLDVAALAKKSKLQIIAKSEKYRAKAVFNHIDSESKICLKLQNLTDSPLSNIEVCFASPVQYTTKISKINANKQKTLDIKIESEISSQFTGTEKYSGMFSLKGKKSENLTPAMLEFDCLMFK